MNRHASLRQRFVDPLFAEVDASSLVFFRVAFGVIMLVECWRFWAHGWISRHYIEPQFFFKYYGFEWVEPWPGSGMYWHFALLAVLSLLITLGALYRLAAVLFFFAFSYVFLLDQARYLNHFYLVILIALIMMVVPANRTLAMDAALLPRLRSATVPAWSVWLFRLQFEVVYIYAGIVKINEDWLRLEPLGMWLARRDDWPLVGELFNQDWVVAVAAYGSIAIHVIGAPLLLFRRTRGWVMALYFVFHLANHFLFQIGIFPWVAMAGTLLFLEPDWPRRALRWTRQAAARALRRGTAVARG
jgi:vitamin K-dependent gamma-carboxylase